MMLIVMRVLPFAAILILSGSSAFAQTYGTDDGGCDLYSTGAKVGESAVHFDGMRLSALNWECELTPAAGDAYVGLCTGEDGEPPMQVTFTITSEGDTVTVSSDADDQVYALKRCAD